MLNDKMHMFCVNHDCFSTCLMTRTLVSQITITKICLSVILCVSWISVIMVVCPTTTRPPMIVSGGLL